MSDIEIDQPAIGVRRITLNRPDALNAFSYSMYNELLAALAALRHDPEAQVVILTGTGRAFCAGHDIRSAGKPDWVRGDPGRAQNFRAVMGRLGEIPLAMRALPQPVIAAVNGAAAGLGYLLALASDMCVVGRSAKFVNAFHNAGTGHEMGFSYLLPRAIGTQRAAELLLTGRPVLAEEAVRIGLALRLAEDDALQADALAVAEAVAANSPIGVALTKQSLWLNQSIGSLEAAIEVENRAIYMSQSTEDSAERRRAFVEKRRPVFQNR